MVLEEYASVRGMSREDRLTVFAGSEGCSRQTFYVVIAGEEIDAVCSLVSVMIESSGLFLIETAYEKTRTIRGGKVGPTATVCSFK